MTTTKKALFLILAASLLAGIGQLLWKKASFSLGLSLQSFFNFYLIFGILLYIAATLLMILSFREGELSVLHPFLATSYVWVTLIAPIFFVSESLDFFKIAGVFIIFAGVSLIGIGGRKNGD